MINFLIIFLCISIFIIFWGMIGYPISLKIINQFIKKQINKDYTYKPSVTIMIVAHNEEKVIEEKLNNVLLIDYPNDKIDILVSSDNSTDSTNKIVKLFIEKHPDKNIRLCEVERRMGKTNAQNEAAKVVTSEILVMTDANAMLDKNAINELVAAFSNEDIVYVTGKLIYINEGESWTSNSESNYWNLDLFMRDVESRIQTITAGNGALYACRTKDYHSFNPVECHDSSMPLYYALNKKRAIFNPDAIAYEKAGENEEDEFGRKVRMNRIILKSILPKLCILNVFKYHWFTYFYIGHRTCRYLLWFSHIVLFLSNLLLINQGALFQVLFVGQVIFYLIGILKKAFSINNKIFNLVYYYCLTVLAQIKGVLNILTGKAKPFWEKAESTR